MIYYGLTVFRDMKIIISSDCSVRLHLAPLYCQYDNNFKTTHHEKADKYPNSNSACRRSGNSHKLIDLYPTAINRILNI